MKKNERKRGSFKKLVLVNLDDYSPEIELMEKATSSAIYRYNLDLALPCIARVAHELGIPVVGWNEFFMGQFVPIEELVDPGDIVGFSCLVTGVGRIESLIQRSRDAGAHFVIGGGDAIQFRPHLSLQKGFDAVVYRDGFKQIACLLKILFEKNTLPQERIWGLATKVHQPLMNPSNSNVLILNKSKPGLKDFSKFAEILGEYNTKIPHYFIQPFFEIYKEHWDRVVVRVQENFRLMFGHVFQHPEKIYQGPVNLATGCSHTTFSANPVCSFCSIAEVQNIGNFGSVEYFKKLKSYYKKIGFNTLFANQPDGGYTFKRVPLAMKKAGFVDWELLELYGRLQTIAQNPDILTYWKGTTKRLVLNSSFEAVGDILSRGAYKGTRNVSIEDLHWRAVDILRKKEVYLHTAFIFGLLGSTAEDYFRSIEASKKVVNIMGDYMYLLEGHSQWFSIGAPFTDQVIASYQFAKVKAREFSGKFLSEKKWYEAFGRHINSFALPIQSQEVGYLYFTQTTRDEAELAVSTLSDLLGGRGREFKIE